MSIKKNLLLISLALLTFSCDKSKKNIKPIIEFTTKITKETSDFVMQIPTQTSVSNWDGINFINQGSNFAVLNKFDFYKEAIKSKGKIIAAPIIQSAKLFILDEKNTVACFDLNSKKQIWQANINKDSLTNKVAATGGVTFANNLLYVSNGSRDLVILDANTGYEIARPRMPDILNAPVEVGNKHIYASLANNSFIALNKETLNLAWQVAGPQTSLMLLMQSAIKPAEISNAVLVPFYSGQLSMLNKESGEPIWENNLLSQLDDFDDMNYANLITQPIFAQDGVFASSASGIVSKINLNSGQSVWRKNIEDVLGMAKFGNALVITTNAQQIACISAESGQISWVVDLQDIEAKHNKANNLLTPLMLNDKVYVISSAGKMYEFSAAGALITTHKIPKDVSFYAVHQEKLYLFANEGIFANK